MDDRKIIDMIAQQPGIRAVQLADRMDVELREMVAELQELMEAGTIVQLDGTAPNGMPCKVYELSAEFAKSRAPAPASNIEVLQQFVDRAEPPALVIPKLSDAMPHVERTPAQRAIDHLKACGSATDNDLRVVMGLRAGQYPSSYLGTAVKQGLVNKDGKDWKPGQGSAVKPAKSLREHQDPKPARGPVAKFSRDSVVITGDVVMTGVIHASDLPNVHQAPPGVAITHAFPVSEPVADVASPPVAPADAPPALRCGIWSDGVVELQRGGSPIAFLSEEEASFMAQFLTRVSKVAA